MIQLRMTSPNGITLGTSGKYCPDNVEVIPVLQEKTVAVSEGPLNILPDSGKVGLSKVTVNVDTPFWHNTITLAEDSATLTIPVEDDVTAVIVYVAEDEEWYNTATTFLGYWLRSKVYATTATGAFSGSTARAFSYANILTNGALEFRSPTSTPYLQGVTYHIIKVKEA